jgi:hypothetical protein
MDKLQPLRHQLPARDAGRPEILSNTKKAGCITTAIRRASKKASPTTSPPVRRSTPGICVRSCTYFLVRNDDGNGWNTFTHFNQQYRLKSNSLCFVAYNHALLDMLSESFASVGRQVDVTPFVQLVGGYITPAQRERNLRNNS